MFIDEIVKVLGREAGDKVKVGLTREKSPDPDDAQVRPAPRSSPPATTVIVTSAPISAIPIITAALALVLALLSEPNLSRVVVLWQLHPGSVLFA